jgi:hypothetical protein
VCADFADKVAGTPAFRVAEAQAAAIVPPITGKGAPFSRFVKVGQSMNPGAMRWRRSSEAA